MRRRNSNRAATYASRINNAFGKPELDPEFGSRLRLPIMAKSRGAFSRRPKWTSWTKPRVTATPRRSWAVGQRRRLCSIRPQQVFV